MEKWERFTVRNSTGSIYAGPGLTEAQMFDAVRIAAEAGRAVIVVDDSNGETIPPHLVACGDDEPPPLTECPECASPNLSAPQFHSRDSGGRFAVIKCLNCGLLLRSDETDD
jgi:hypothetical protein